MGDLIMKLRRFLIYMIAGTILLSTVGCARSTKKGISESGAVGSSGVLSVGGSSAAVLSKAGVSGSSAAAGSNGTANGGGGAGQSPTTGGSVGAPAYNGPITVSRVSKTGDGKYYLEVAGRPFMMSGAQIRTDFLSNVDFLSLGQMEKYFAAAAKLGVTTVEVPIQWSDIEGDMNEYTYKKLDTFLGYCNKYNLKMEILWFGSNMCGVTHSFHVPDYILKDGKTYPKTGDGHYWDMYGDIWTLDMDNANLLARESKAVSMMMNEVWRWDRMNGGRHPVISLQVENEPDSYPRWQGGDWNGLLKELDVLGQAAKDSNYKVVTRVNVCSVIAVENWAKGIYNLSGIDIVGFDPYVYSSKEIKEAVNNFSSDLPGNFPLVAENKGAIDNGSSLMLAAYASGGAYDIYELATMQYIGRSTEDFGVLNRDLTDRSYTGKVRTLLQCLKNLAPDVALTGKNNFAAFNIGSSNPKQSVNQTIQAGNVSITYATSSGGIAAAMVRSGYLSAFSTTAGQMTFKNAALGTAETGYYDSGNIWHRTGSAAVSGSTLKMSSGTAYRVQVKSTQSALASTAQQAIGTSTAQQSMGAFTSQYGDWSYSSGAYTTYDMFEGSAMSWNGGKKSGFHFSSDVMPRFIGGSGFGIFFGAQGTSENAIAGADYVKINQSWSDVWYEIRVAGSVSSGHLSMTGVAFSSKKLDVMATGGALKVTYGGQVIYSKNVSLPNGSLGLMSWGFYGDFTNISIS